MSARAPTFYAWVSVATSVVVIADAEPAGALSLDDSIV